MLFNKGDFVVLRELTLEQYYDLDFYNKETYDLYYGKIGIISFATKEEDADIRYVAFDRDMVKINSNLLYYAPEEEIAKIQFNVFEESEDE